MRSGLCRPGSDLPLSQNTSLSRFKPETPSQRSQYEQDLPAWARRLYDKELARRVRDAIATCRCLSIDYPNTEGLPQRRLFCPTAMGLKHGRLKAEGMQQKASDLPAEHMGVFVSGISFAEFADVGWIPTLGDLKESTQFDPARITHVSRCPGDPSHDHIRLFPYRELDGNDNQEQTP